MSVTMDAIEPLRVEDENRAFVRHRAQLAVLTPFIAAREIGLTEIAVLDAAAARYPLLDEPWVAVAFALALRAPRAGHLGVMLHRAFGRLAGAEPHGHPGATGVAGTVEAVTTETSTQEPSDPTKLRRAAALRAALPATAAAWVAAVRAHACVAITDEPVSVTAARDYDTPFVWQPVTDAAAPAGTPSGILMTRRMWQQQARLAAAIGQKVGDQPTFVMNPTTREARLHALYPDADEPQAAKEARAAARAVATGCFSVITGGPGTGKTWGIKRVLALLLEAAHDQDRPLTIELAAPTGKAAVRMAEAMGEDLDGLADQGIAPAVTDRLRALQPRTLHKLLGVTPHAPQRFRHGIDNPLAADVVVVDEASMIDVVLMRHLMEAIPAGGRVVLLGDRDQLASVEAGTVLADLVSGVIGIARQARIPGLPARIVRLTHSFRFQKAASVACVAEGLQLRTTADRDDVVDLMCRRPPVRQVWRDRIVADPKETLAGVGRISWLDQPSTASATDRPTPAAWSALVARLARPYLDAAVDDLRHGIDSSGHRRGSSPGFLHLLVAAQGQANRRASPAFHRQLLDALGRYRVLCAHRRGPRGVAGLNKALTGIAKRTLARAWPSLPTRGTHWLGRPVLITENAYDVDLRNGDVGLVVEGPDGALTLGFPQGIADVRYVALARLPSHETAFAMTVHKSQGSQFDRVAMVLPAETGSQLLTRELVYTGITRAMWRVDWIGTEAVLREAVHRDVQRASGLADLLWV